MKKLLLPLLFLCCIQGYAQELTPEYLAQSREFIQALRDDYKLSWKIYIWEPESEGGLFPFSSTYDSSSETPWICFQTDSGSERRMTDTIKMSRADMYYLNHNLTTVHDAEWKQKLMAGTGILADEQWMVEDKHNYKSMSAPQFLQNGTVCVVYFSDGIPAVYEWCNVYKKKGKRWVFISREYELSSSSGRRSFRDNPPMHNRPISSTKDSRQ